MHIISLCIPFYSHLKSQKSLIENVVGAGHTVTVVTHHRLQDLVQQCGAQLHAVDWMESFLDDPAIQEANGIAYTAAMLWETAIRVDEMTEVVQGLEPDALIFDSATRWGKMIGVRLGLPTVARSAMYPPLYQYYRTGQIWKVLLRDMVRAPWAMIKIGQAVTKLIFDHKPIDYDELYTRLYDDNAIGTHTAIPQCMMEDTVVQNLHVYAHHGLTIERAHDDPQWTRLEHETRTIIYLSLGTLISVDQKILDTLEGVAGDQILFVVSTGPNGTCGRSQGVVRQSFVPQKQILDYTTLCITHGGINTVIECMAREIPMLCVPFLTDQHMYAHRIKHLGIGKVQGSSILRSKIKLKKILHTMLLDQLYAVAYTMIDLSAGVHEYSKCIAHLEKDAG